MRPIQMVDLKQQYLQIKEEVDKGIHAVLDSSAYINGKPVQDFAAALAGYMGVKHVIPCANGTDALQIAMMALNLQPGDEVITPSPDKGDCTRAFIRPCGQYGSNHGDSERA